MEVARIFLNKKSIILFIVLFCVNAGLFYRDFLLDYEALPEEEIHEIDCGKKYEEIEQRIRKMKGIAIFHGWSDEKKDQKMLEDYAKIRDVRGRTHRVDGVSLWFASSIPNYLVLLSCVWLIFISFDTERRGLFPLVYATSGGRGILAFRHLICWFLAVLGFSTLFHSTLLVMACVRVQDFSALFQPIQLVNGMETCILPVNGLSFFLINTLGSACGIFVVALLFWMFLIMVHNSKIALMICGCLFVLEFFLSHWILDQSQWAMLKYINIMTLLNLNQLSVDYRLYTIGSFCLERREWVYLAMLVLVILLSVVCLILASKRRPYYEEHFFERSVNRFCGYVRAALCKLPGWGLEWHKVLVSQKGFIVLVFFIIILVRGVWQPVSEGEQLMLGSTGEYMRDFYEQWGGPVTDGVRTDVAKRERKLQQLIEDENPTVAYYSAGLKKVQERMAYIDRHREMGLWLVDPGGYQYLFGTKGENGAAESAVLVLLCLAALISGIFAYDKKSSMEPLLRAAPNGRGKLQRRKYGIVGILVCFLWAVAGGMEIYNILQIFPLTELNAPLQSLSFMKAVPMRMTIWQYVLLVYAIRLVWLLLIALLYSEIAVAVKNQEISILLCSLLLIPSVLYMMGVKSVSCFAVTKIIHVSHFFRQGYPGIWKEIVAFLAGIAVLLICLQYRRRSYVKN